MPKTEINRVLGKICCMCVQKMVSNKLNLVSSQLVTQLYKGWHLMIKLKCIGVKHNYPTAVTIVQELQGQVQYRTIRQYCTSYSKKKQQQQEKKQCNESPLKSSLQKQLDFQFYIYQLPGLIIFLSDATFTVNKAQAITRDTLLLIQIFAYFQIIIVVGSLKEFSYQDFQLCLST